MATEDDEDLEPSTEEALGVQNLIVLAAFVAQHPEHRGVLEMTCAKMKEDYSELERRRHETARKPRL